MEGTVGIVGKLFPVISEVVEGGLGIMGNLLKGSLELFWNDGAFTDLGQLLLVVIGAPLVIWGIRFVINLVKSIRLK